MPETEVAKSEITYSAAISACEKGGQWELALTLLSLMPEAIADNSFMYRTHWRVCPLCNLCRIQFSLRISSSFVEQMRGKYISLSKIVKGEPFPLPTIVIRGPCHGERNHIQRSHECLRERWSVAACGVFTMPNARCTSCRKRNHVQRSHQCL